jgi:hypothetical protein
MLPKIDEHITFYQFQSAFCSWAEGTSTSPSSRHLDQYKCLLADDDCQPAYNDDYKDPNERIMKVYYQIAIAALSTATSLYCWQNSTMTMIEKILGYPRINILRVIHLFEADYNLILKIIWARRLVWNAQYAGKLNEGQSGSRPGRNSINVVVQKDMKYWYSRLTR